MFDALRNQVRDRLEYVRALVTQTSQADLVALEKAEDLARDTRNLVEHPGWVAFNTELTARREALARRWMDGPEEDAGAVRLAAKELETLAGWANRVMAAGADARQRLDAHAAQTGSSLYVRGNR